MKTDNIRNDNKNNNIKNGSIKMTTFNDNMKAII
jgi:hypothetical protein